jgi:pimeloyl-ACP methyl ester carboxylesterase
MNVVFLHGFGEDASVWTDFITHLPKKHTYFTPDFSHLKSCFSISEYAEWLKKELDKAKIEQLVLIGHSMGGYIALEFAELHTEQILGLGLFHSSAAPDSEEKREARDKTIQFLIKHDTDLFIKHFYPNMFNEQFKHERPELIADNIAKFTKIPNEALLAATLAMKGRKGQLNCIEDFDFPIFQIIGQLDTFVNYMDALEQTALLKHPNVLLLHSISHAGMYESPEICADYIANFINRV